MQFTPNEWLVVALVFVLGLILGMAAMASGKWKNRYREEVRKREAAEAERGRLESQLKHAEARTIASHARETRDTPIA